LADKNTSPDLTNLLVRVATLSNGNLLQNADGGAGGVGSSLTVPSTGAYADGILSPGQSVDVPFLICLKQNKSFSFFVDVLGRIPSESVYATVDGSIQDGLDFPKDGIPDRVNDGTIVQVLNVARPNNPFEDRGAIEFNISQFPPAPAQVNLVLNRFAANGPFPFRVDVYTYEGDGLLSLADFSAGTLFTSFDYAGESVVRLDVTAFVAGLVNSKKTFAGFVLRTVPSPIPSNGPFVAFNSIELPPPAQLSASFAP
jgi:hypothetical protein